MRIEGKKERKTHCRGDQLPSYSSGNWASAAATGIESAPGIEYLNDLVPRMHRMDMCRRANERRHLIHPITEE